MCPSTAQGGKTSAPNLRMSCQGAELLPRSYKELVGKPRAEFRRLFPSAPLIYQLSEPLAPSIQPPSKGFCDLRSGNEFKAPKEGGNVGMVHRFTGCPPECPRCNYRNGMETGQHVPCNTWNCGWGEKAEPETTGTCERAERPDGVPWSQGT